jgi:hypothetical protein
VPGRYVVGAEFEYISEEDIRFLGDAIASQLKEKSNSWFKKSQ